MITRSLPILLATSAALSLPALATPITITTSALPSMAFAPSSDTFTLNAGSITTSGPGAVTVQTGSFNLGDSEIADQIIAFSFAETMTLNGITKTFNIFGQDNVTTASDILTLFASSPVNFGAFSFTLNSSTETGTAIGQAMPVSVSGIVSASAVPEPASLALFGTGLFGIVFVKAGLTARLE